MTHTNIVLVSDGKKNYTMPVRQADGNTLVPDYQHPNAKECIEALPLAGECRVTGIRYNNVWIYDDSINKQGYVVGGMAGLKYSAQRGGDWKFLGPAWYPDREQFKKFSDFLAKTLPVNPEPQQKQIEQKETPTMATLPETTTAVPPTPGILAEATNTLIEGASLGLVLGAAREAQAEVFTLMKALGASDELINHPLIKALVKGGTPMLLGAVAPHVPGLRHPRAMAAIKTAQTMAIAEATADGVTSVMQIARPIIKMALNFGGEQKEITGEVESEDLDEAPSIQVNAL